MSETPEMTNPVPLLPQFNHEIDPNLVREYPALWDTLRHQSRVFRSDVTGWNIWYLLGFDEMREAFQRSDLFEPGGLAIR